LQALSYWTSGLWTLEEIGRPKRMRQMVKHIYLSFKSQTYWTYSLNIFWKYLEYARICSNILDCFFVEQTWGLSDGQDGWAVRTDVQTHEQPWWLPISPKIHTSTFMTRKALYELCWVFPQINFFTSILLHKVRAPIPSVYVGFYTMYYWMILTAIL
jgi:hypothetical protein